MAASHTTAHPPIQAFVAWIANSVAVGGSHTCAPSYARLCYAFLIRAILEPIVPPVAASLGCSRGVLAPVSGQFPLPSFSARTSLPSGPAASGGLTRNSACVPVGVGCAVPSTDMRFAPWRALRRRSRRAPKVRTASRAVLPSSGPHRPRSLGFAQWIDFCCGSPAGCCACAVVRRALRTFSSPCHAQRVHEARWPLAIARPSLPSSACTPCSMLSCMNRYRSGAASSSPAPASPGVESDPPATMPTDTERPAARGWDSPPRGVDLGFRRERLPLCSLLRHTDDRTSTDPARLDHTNYGHRSVRYITPWWLLPTQRHLR